LVARNFNEPVANMIGGDPAWNRFLAMFILFMGTSLLIWVAFGFVRSSIEKMHLKAFDRHAGAAVGALKGAIICTLITLFACSLLGEQVCRSICTSRSGNYIARGLTHVGNVVPEEIAQYINPYIDNFQKEIDEHQNEGPQQFNPFQPGGLMPANNSGQWGNPAVTQNGGPTERVGQLQPATGTQWQPPQPVYNGSTGQWEAPQAQPAPQQPANNDGQFQFQLPQIDWRSAAQKAAEDAANQVFNPNGGGN
ncbi:MAG: CvpA family protein, partial [Pirellulaceae bacterium]